MKKIYKIAQENLKVFQQKDIIAGLTSLLILFLLLYLVFFPAVRQFHSLSREIKNRTIDLTRVKSPVQEYQVLEAEASNMGKQIDGLKNKLFWEKDISKFLNEITHLASSGIELISFKPESSLPALGKEESAFGDKYKFSQTPISVTLKSGYGDLVEFLKKIEEAEKFIKIEALTIENDPDNIYQHNVNIKFSIFTKEEAV
ncbi:MAG: type 4a pilus biogenesis protein PilO [Candidatus Omnitrophota bacterium]